MHLAFPTDLNEFNLPAFDCVVDRNFADDVLTGLSLAQKQLPPKYFYDQQGSHYFDQICQLEEYYPYQTELTLLQQVAQDLAGSFTNDSVLVEFGAGSLIKVQPLPAGLSG